MTAACGSAQELGPPGRRMAHGLARQPSLNVFVLVGKAPSACFETRWPSCSLSSAVLQHGLSTSFMHVTGSKDTSNSGHALPLSTAAWGPAGHAVWSRVLAPSLGRVPDPKPRNWVCVTI